MTRSMVIEGIRHHAMQEGGRCDACPYNKMGDPVGLLCTQQLAEDTLLLLDNSLTPYLAAAAIYVTATPNDGKVNVEAIIESARALRAAEMAEEK
jgi:hypothetical protein